MLQELKELYANRDLKKVRSLVDAYFADDCVVFGTCVGEMGKSKQDVFDLIDSDLRLGEEDIENNYLEEQKEYYESQLKELKSELEKYKGLKKDDFKGDEDAYIEYKLDQRLKAEQVKQMGENSRKAAQDFDFKKLSKKLIEIIENV